MPPPRSLWERGFCRFAHRAEAESGRIVEALSGLVFFFNPPTIRTSPVLFHPGTWRVDKEDAHACRISPFV